MSASNLSGPDMPIAPNRAPWVGPGSPLVLEGRKLKIVAITPAVRRLARAARIIREKRREHAA